MGRQYVFWRHDDKPTFIMLVGIAGSGKSTIAENIYAEDADGNINKPIIHSLDKIREEMYGNSSKYEKNSELLKEVHKRIKEDLKNDKNVIYDATNITKKLRVSFLNELKKVSSYKQCICVMTPYNVCLQQNQERDKKTSEDAIRQMYMSWTPPDYCEGFDSILPIYNYGNNEIKQRYTLNNLLKVMDPFEQESAHHEFTLGVHCRQAYKFICNTYPDDYRLKMAAVLHDNGKVFTKTYKNAKGVEDGQVHYFNHHCVGAYDSMFYTDVAKMNHEDQIAIANMIFYHMHPKMSWEQSEKAKKKDIRLIGEDMYKTIMKLYAADQSAHTRTQEVEQEIKQEEREIRTIER